MTRSFRPMLAIVHKYLVMLTWRILCLQLCSRKTEANSKVILSAREELRAQVQRLALSSEKLAGVWNSLLLDQSWLSQMEILHSWCSFSLSYNLLLRDLDLWELIILLKKHLLGQNVFLQSLIYPSEKTIYWNKQHFGMGKSHVLPTELPFFAPWKHN